MNQMGKMLEILHVYKVIGFIFISMHILFTAYLNHTPAYLKSVPVCSHNSNRECQETLCGTYT